MPRRKRNLYLTVLAVGALALLVDQFLLSGGTPESAIAEPPPSAAQIDPPAAEEPGGADEPLLPLVPFPAVLAGRDAKVPLRDIFSPPASVMAKQKEAAALRAAAKKGHPDSADFQAKHHLQAIADYGTLRIAVTKEGKWLRVGDVLDGCTVSSISGTVVRFACHDGEALLSVSR